MAEPDSTQQLQAVHDSVDRLHADVEGVNQALQSLSNNHGLVIDDTTITGKLDSMLQAIGSQADSPLDYSSSLSQLSELLVYTDMLLLVLILFVVVLCGVSVGRILTDRLKLGNDG